MGQDDLCVPRPPAMPGTQAGSGASWTENFLGAERPFWTLLPDLRKMSASGKVTQGGGVCPSGEEESRVQNATRLGRSHPAGAVIRRRGAPSGRPGTVRPSFAGAPAAWAARGAEAAAASAGRARRPAPARGGRYIGAGG